jgi:hypothetical protein
MRAHGRRNNSPKDQHEVHRPLRVLKVAQGSELGRPAALYLAALYRTVESEASLPGAWNEPVNMAIHGIHAQPHYPKRASTLQLHSFVETSCLHAFLILILLLSCNLCNFAAYLWSEIR